MTAGKKIKIFPVDTNKDIKIVKNLFIEYADSLGFDLCFQNFDEELAKLPGQYARQKRLPAAGRV